MKLPQFVAKGRLRKTTRRLLWLVLLGLLLWTLMRFLQPEDHWVGILWGTYLIPWLMWAELAIALLAVTQRWWGAALLSLGLALPWVIFYYANPQTVDKENATQEEEFTVLSYSVRGCFSDANTIAKVVKENPADLIVIQEVHPIQKLKELVEDLYAPNPVYVCAWPGAMLISRYPVQPLSYPVCRVNHPAGTFQVWNVHWNKAYFNNRLQLKDLERLEREIKRYPGPRLLVGDFNTTRFTEIYRKVSQHHTHAHEQAGCNFAFTFPTPVRRFSPGFPFLGIDHIFFTDEFSATDCNVLDVYGKADHYPIWTRLVFEPELNASGEEQ